MKDLRLLVCAVSMMAMPAWGAEFKDTKFGYSVTAPDFPGPPSGNVAMRLNVLASPVDGFAPNMNVMIQELGITREEFMARSVRQFVETGMTLRSAKNRDVSGRPAVLVDYEGQVRGHNLRFLQLAVFLPQRVLLLTYTATASTFAGHEAEFRRSLDTFKLTSR